MFPKIGLIYLLRRYGLIGTGSGINFPGNFEKKKKTQEI